MSMSDDSGDVNAKQKLDPFIMDVRDYLMINKSPGESPGYKAMVYVWPRLRFSTRA